MTREVFQAQVAKLLAEYSDKDWTDARIELWWDELRCLPDDVFVKGVSRLIANRVYTTMPAVGEVLKASIGDHYHIVPFRRRPVGRELTVDEIHSQYKAIEEKKTTESRARIGSTMLKVACNNLPDLKTLVMELKEELKQAKAGFAAMKITVAKLRTDLEASATREQALQKQLDKFSSVEYTREAERRRKVLAEQHIRIQKAQGRQYGKAKSQG